MARPRADLGRAGALEPPGASSRPGPAPASGRSGAQAWALALTLAESPRAGGKHPRNTCCPGKPMGQDSGFPVATTCRPECHGPLTQQAPLPSVGISGATICPHSSLQTRKTLARQSPSEGKTTLGKTHPPAPFPPPEFPKLPTLGASLCHPGVGSRARRCLGTHTA